MKPEIIDEQPVGVYRIVVDLPARLPEETLHAVGDAVAEAVFAFEEEHSPRDWDSGIAAGFGGDHSLQAAFDREVALTEEYRELLHYLWLHVNWRFLTGKITTRQRELWAHAVDNGGDPDERGPKVDRWWE